MGDEANRVELAAAALAEVNDELMARTGVVGTYAGLLRDAQGSPTSEVGIIVLIGPESAGGDIEALALPGSIGGFRVQVRRSAPGPEER